ncbi:MAG TPA: hypothetical protein VK925_08470, partial [Jiangellaceae bacterium]|nr:hypothetical protein [Jiangellaceae bacterium]
EPDDGAAHLDQLVAARRAITVRIAGTDRWAAVEDAGRLRDALGVPPPVGVPQPFLEPVSDPLGDLVSRYARTHAPFRADDVARRLGLGVAVVTDALRRLSAAGRVVDGEFTPGRSGAEWCDTEVLRRLRRRSLAALRKEAEPVDPVALGRFLPAWQHVGSSLSGPEGVLRVVEQLGGCAVPASGLERLILPARSTGYSPAWLDELTAAGEVLWAGHGALPGTDGWVSLHTADAAPLTLPEPDPEPPSTPLHDAVLSLLEPGGAFFFRQIADAVAATDDTALVTALWDLVWTGRLTNDTLAPLRVLVAGGRPTHRSRPNRPRSRYARPRPAMPSRTGPPAAAGRWSLLPELDTDPTRRAHAAAEGLLDRHGVITRGAVVAERLPGGYAAAYRVLSAFEDSGRARRGYFVAGLGAAQFATIGAADRLRSYSDTAARREPVPALVLAATDPANPYGAALAWPDRPGESGGHRPGRKAGALVVLVDGALVLYVERGGRTLLSWSDDPDTLRAGADALALAVRDGALGTIRVERADGEAVQATALGEALSAAGFHVTPRGLRLRA